MSAADSFRALEETHASLSETALRIKDERDEAVKLLSESLLYSYMGQNGHFKTRVREFLTKVRK
jgi:hypothetical protein